MKNIQTLGWNSRLESIWQDINPHPCVPGRVIADYGSGYKVSTDEGDVSAHISGRLDHLSESEELPKVGDWVAVQPLEECKAVIHSVLPRASAISRKEAGNKPRKQILAANIDIAFLVQSLDDDFSPPRLQRYLFQLSQDHIQPVVILNKVDKSEDLSAALQSLSHLKSPVIVTNALTGKGIDELEHFMQPGKTAVFLGSSGVGKSTLINQLLGQDIQKTVTVRDIDSKGRHTTTHRELFLLKNGSMIIDTPGVRELQLWGSEEDLSASFPDIEDLAKSCKFTNCTHNEEPNCAVLAAIEEETLDSARLKAYKKFQSELRFLASKVDVDAQHDRKKAFKNRQKEFNRIIRSKKL
jgi:ribosome biogenesis GTPase